MTFDLGTAYHDARLRIADLVAGVDGDRSVPATPAWDVHDVVAHLAGVAEDAVAGNMDGVTTAPWTAAQVARGRGRSIDELLADWAVTGPFVETFLSSPDGGTSASAVIDVCTHEADLRHALGRPPEVPAPVLAWAGARLSEGFAAAVADQGLPAVRVGASAFELLRGRLGRRTEAEVRAQGWSTDPAPYLDLFFIFGRRTESLGEATIA